MIDSRCVRADVQDLMHLQRQPLVPLLNIYIYGMGDVLLMHGPGNSP